MRYFICALDGIGLGIPSERTERVISAGRQQTAVYETADGETFISLPLLFRLKDSAAPHGIVLKPSPAGEGGDAAPSGAAPDEAASDGAAHRTVLLTPAIDIDLEIPEEDIHMLPDALGDLHRYFRGVYFDGKNMILILDPDKLMEGSHD